MGILNNQHKEGRMKKPNQPWKASDPEFAKAQFSGWEFPGIEDKLAGVHEALFEAAFNGAKQMLHNLFCSDKKCCGGVAEFFSAPFLDSTRNELCDPFVVRLYTEVSRDDNQSDLFTVDVPVRAIFDAGIEEASPSKRRAFIKALRDYADALEK